MNKSEFCKDCKDLEECEEEDYDTEILDCDYKKTWKCCVCGRVNFIAICLVVDGIWRDYCTDCYKAIEEAK